MPRLGLALSGGGFRATLFHLGVIRYLRDAGQLKDVTDIASVSGGSILSAHLVLNWDRYCGDDDRFAEAAAEIVRFVKFDVRNRIVRRLPMQLPLRILAKLTRRQARNLTPNAILEHYYRKFLYGDRCLYELPEKPHAAHPDDERQQRRAVGFQPQRVVHSTAERQRRACVPAHSRSTGEPAESRRCVVRVSWVFSTSRDYRCRLGSAQGQYPTEWFTDGGVYDNLSIRAFSWLMRQDAKFDQILVSDAGKPFQILSEGALGVFGQSVRATDILWDRVWQLERENFGQQPGFVFLPITKVVDLSADPTAMHPVVQAEVQSIRTDLDRFSDAEINALVQHGYEVARESHRQRPATQAAYPANRRGSPIPGRTGTIQRRLTKSKSFAPVASDRDRARAAQVEPPPRVVHTTRSA